MNNAAQWWYMQELKRKTSRAESDRERVQRNLQLARDEPSKLRLKRELESIEIRLQKLKRGVWF